MSEWNGVEPLERRRLLSDFNYYGRVSPDDYGLIDPNFAWGNPFPGGSGVVAVGNTPPTTVNGTAGSDRILIYPVGEQIIISVNGTGAFASSDALAITANGGDDVIWIDPKLSVSAATIYGGAGNDTIYGSSGIDRIFAGDGNDLIYGQDGRDKIYGEGGDDSLRGGGGSDLLDGGDGADTLRGDAGNDNLSGGANPDRLRGSAGDDTLRGGGGRDLLAGEIGNDALYGEAGDDVLDGGLGDDIMSGGTGTGDVADGGDGDDSYDSSDDLVTGDGVTAQGLTKTGAGTLTLTGNNTYNSTTTATLVGSSGGTKLDLNDNKLVVSSSGGTSGSVTGLLTSGYNSGSWSVSGIVTSQTSATGGNTLTSVGVASNLDLGTQTFGGQTVSGSDTLAMYTYGGDANLDGVINSDDYALIDHGFYNGDFNYDGVINGDDYFLIDPHPSPIAVNGTGKSDRILIYSNGANVSISVNGNVTTTYSYAFAITANGGDDVVGIDPKLVGVHATIYGGAGNDSVYGSNGDDRIFAGEGNDLVYGNDGRDKIYGEAGDDSVRGGGGSDLLDGGDGYDTCRGDAGNDNIAGGANPDRLRGSLGNDTLNGNGGRDLLAGEGGDDQVFGGAGDDVCDGGDGADTLRGGDGHDAIAVDPDHDDCDLSEVADGEAASTSNIIITDAGGVSGGSSGLTKVGSGTLTLSGNNTAYSGNTTIDAGTLQIAADITTSTWGGEITVGGNGTLQVSSTTFDHSANGLHLLTGGTFSFADVGSTASFGTLTADAGSYLVFHLGPTTSQDQIHVTRDDGLHASSGALIKIVPASNITSGTYTLIDFKNGSTTVADFMLAGINDSLHTYTLSVDRDAGKVMLKVAHV